MRDIFQPQHDPAKSIYDAFQTEARRRAGRSVEEWMAAELAAVLREATIQAINHGLPVPTLAEVIRAERYASGSIDYGLTWAYEIVNAMKSNKKRG